MKNFFTLLCLCVSPLMLFAQQQSPSQQLQKEMDAIRMQMQAQIQSLQDSLAKIQQQLAEEQQGKSRFFEYHSPEKGDFYFSMPDSFNWDHAFGIPCPPDENHSDFPQGFEFMMPPVPQVPAIPPQEFHFEMPDMDFYKAMPYEYHFNMPPVPEVPQSPDFYHEKKHKHDDFLHGLPFYDWFKS